VSLFHLIEPQDLVAPAMIVALDSWVDAGSASTAAAGAVAGEGDVVATFDGDLLFDYRARRPTLEIIDGRPSELTWPELVMRRSRVGERDVLVLTGPEPDYRWRELAGDMVEIAQRLKVGEWISLGAIPAAVPHTRSVPVLGTASASGLLQGGVEMGPIGLLRVPSACISVLDHAVARAGVPAVGYYAQVPHYVSGAYPAAAVELLKVLGRHLAAEIALGALAQEALQLRNRLDAAAAIDEQTRDYVQRLESMADEARLPTGDELISDIERFLRQGRTDEGGGRLN
jgi:proteasome assembly chaperone (PAC2) family protein